MTEQLHFHFKLEKERGGSRKIRKCVPGRGNGLSWLAQMVKNLPANVGDAGSISGLASSSGEGNGNQSQYSCLGNPMDRGAW